MQLNEFITNLYSARGDFGKVTSVCTYYDKEIVINENNECFVNGKKVEGQFSNLEEVKQYIDNQEESTKTLIQIYEEQSNTKIAAIIRKHNESIKITNQLVESYINTASSKCFTIDPIILEMRSTNRLDSEIDGKIIFKLNDCKQVALSEETIEKIAKLLNNLELKEKTIDYMRESRDNFLTVMRLL